MEGDKLHGKQTNAIGTTPRLAPSAAFGGADWQDDQHHAIKCACNVAGCLDIGLPAPTASGASSDCSTPTTHSILAGLPLEQPEPKRGKRGGPKDGDIPPTPHREDTREVGLPGLDNWGPSCALSTDSTAGGLQERIKDHGGRRQSTGVTTIDHAQGTASPTHVPQPHPVAPKSNAPSHRAGK